MGYPHPHFQGPIGGGGGGVVGGALDPKFPPTDEFLSPYHHHHHHHHMHLNHHHHASVSPLHNGYASNGSANPMGTTTAPNMQPSPVDYYGNPGPGNYSYPSNGGAYYNQPQTTHHALQPSNLSPLHNNSANNSAVQQQQNSSGNNSSSANNGPTNNNPVTSLDPYATNANITEMASVPASQHGSGTTTSMHPYSAATAVTVSNSGAISLANSGGGGGGGVGGGLVGSYYGGYYGAGAAPHHHSVMDLPIQCPHVEPTNTALGLQELGKV